MKLLIEDSLTIRLITFIVVFFLSVSFFIFFIFNKVKTNQAAGEKVDVRFNPSSLSVGLNQEIPPLKIQGKPINNSNNPTTISVRGYQFNIVFNKNSLELLSITYPSSCPEVTEVTTTVSQANENGVIKVACGNITSSGFLMSADFNDLLTLNFKSKSISGSNTITINPNENDVGFSKIESDGSLTTLPFFQNQTITATVVIGESPASTIPPGQPTPTNTGIGSINLTLSLRFQGIGQKPADQYNRMNVKVYALTSTNVKYCGLASVSSNNNGIWSGQVTWHQNEEGCQPIPSSPLYNIKLLVKGPKHLQKRICDPQPTETYPGSYRCNTGKITLQSGNNNLNLSGIYLLVGDLPQQDGIVNAYDASLVRQCLGKNDQSCLSSADLNLDGIVNAQDHSLIIEALSVRTDEE